MRKKSVALVTGASSGIGREFARQLLGDGFVVFSLPTTSSEKPERNPVFGWKNSPRPDNATSIGLIESFVRATSRSAPCAMRRLLHERAREDGE